MRVLDGNCNAFFMPFQWLTTKHDEFHFLCHSMGEKIVETKCRIEFA